MYESMSKKESLPNKSVRRQSCNNMQRPSRIQPKEVVQAKRKVVYNEGSIEQSILWDSNRKKYYKNMKSIEEPDPVTQNIIDGKIKGGADELDKKYNSEQKKYENKSDSDLKSDSKSNPEPDKIGLNEVLLEYDENHFVETNKTNMKVYDGGKVVPENEDIFAIRLYAEGNMDHALGLAQGMNQYLTKDKNQDDDIFPFNKMKGKKVLIKATEFRHIDDVTKAYGEGNVKIKELAAEGNKNLEASFGGDTGDMAKNVKEGELRKYDLIQSTFFWLQDAYKDKIDGIKDTRTSINQLQKKEKSSDKGQNNNIIYTQMSESSGESKEESIKRQEACIKQQENFIEQQDDRVKLQNCLTKMQEYWVKLGKESIEFKENYIKMKKNISNEQEFVIKNAEYLLKDGEEIVRIQKELAAEKEEIVRIQKELATDKEEVIKEQGKLLNMKKDFFEEQGKLIDMKKNWLDDNVRLIKMKESLGENKKSLSNKKQELINYCKPWATDGFNYYYVKRNESSYETMITFVKNQLKKLKEDGKIRLVVSDVEPYNVIKTKLEEALGEEWGVDIFKKELASTYPKELKERGLNESNFAQKQTFANKNVIGKEEEIKKDIIIIIVKKKKTESGI